MSKLTTKRRRLLNCLTRLCCCVWAKRRFIVFSIAALTVSKREAHRGYAIPPECLDRPQRLISTFPYLSRLHSQAVFLAKTFTRISISTLPKKSIYFFLFSFGKQSRLAGIW